jgi:hypothetical protein
MILKATGGVLGAVIVVALLGYVLPSGQLSTGQLLEGLLGDGGNGEMAATAQAPSADAARRQLSELKVRPAGSMAGYSREEFPHWSDAQEYGWKLPGGTPDPESCDARDAALTATAGRSASRPTATSRAVAGSTPTAGRPTPTPRTST